MNGCSGPAWPVLVHSLRCAYTATMRVRPLILGIVFFFSGLGGALAQNEGHERLVEPKQPEQAQQQPPVERFKDWGVRCETAEATGEKICEMFQVVTRTDTGERVMAVIVGYTPENDQPVAAFQLPLGIHLPSGVEFSIDGGESIRVPIQVCFPHGCSANLLLEPSLLQKLRAGAIATVSIRGPQGKQVNLPVSLRGFTAAMKRVAPSG